MSERGSMAGSSRSGNSGAMSETSSQRSDSKMLRKHKRTAEEADEGDLLEQKRSFQEGVFACMYTLVRQSALSSWKWALLKVVLEGLAPFIVVFNPSAEWVIRTGNPLWQLVRWAVWRSPVMRIYGYDTYVRLLYVMAAFVLVAVGGLVWLTLAMRKQEQSKWLRHAAVVLHIVYEMVFMIFYVSFMDYFIFAANCDFTSASKEHAYFTGVKCLEMPHVLHMSVGLFAAAVHFCVTALMVVASCELNPVSRGHLASPDAYSRLKILFAKAAFLIITDDLHSWPKLQVVLMNFTVAYVCWLNFRKLPFYRTTINIVWCSMWVALLYTTLVLSALVFGKDQSEENRRQYTLYVLYGIFPAFAVGTAACGGHAWWASRPARRFAEYSGVKELKGQKVHKFDDPHEVEIVSRVMRRFDADGIVREEAAALGEVVIKAGMAAFPSTPFLHILYANFLLEVRRDGPAARTQLQLAARHAPSLVERYQIHCTNESSKRLKDSQADGMDLQAYIEFRRNFRAVLRVHKEVLGLETELWRLAQKPALRVTEIDASLDALETATARAHQVYKKVLERYPTNGKLLRCYGKFLEDVRHDAQAAARVYAEAARNGGADAIASLDLSSVQAGADKPEFLTSMSLTEDAVVVINMEGTIMMVSQAAQTLFGYPKAELEGANVSMLMPQPFSQRHPAFLARYLATGEPHILDSVREVLALHKERYVFPMDLCVTKMSGTGSDSVFIGVLRPVPSSTLKIRAWLAPNGTFLCGDQQFASLCGLREKELIGRSLASLVDNPESEVAELLDRFRGATEEALTSGLVRTYLRLKHRYLDPVPVEVTVGLGGTDGQRIMALSCTRTDGQEGNILVCDTHGRLRFASLGVAALLSYPLKKLGGMRLEQLLPPPYDTMHAKWLRDPPHDIRPSSCRAGRVVSLRNEAGIAVPVRIKVMHASAASGLGDMGLSLYVVQVDKVAPDEAVEEKRLVLVADLTGLVLEVSRASNLFGYSSAEMLGRSLCDCVDIFDDWRSRNGESQLQLLLLALADREQEIPGTSWRVRVRRPPEEEGSEEDGEEGGSGVPRLPAIAGATRLRGDAAGGDAPTKLVSACLQVELLDDDDASVDSAAAADAGGDADAAEAAANAAASSAARIRLTLWRRDLLSGVVELDDGLVIRRASPLTGLIVGLPSIALLKKPLGKFLDLPRGATWESLSKQHSHKRSALKAGSGGARGTVSAPMAFTGPHPDAGTMRILVQGVQTAAPSGPASAVYGTGAAAGVSFPGGSPPSGPPGAGGRGGGGKVLAVLHPDTSYAGAHADVLRVLHLDMVVAAADATARPSAAVSRMTTARREGDGDAEEDEEDEEGAKAKGGEEEEEEEGGGEGESDGDMSGSGDGGEGAEGGADGEDGEAKAQAKLLERASSKSAFVAQWVRTVSKQAITVPAGSGTGAASGAVGENRPASPSAAAAAASGEGVEGEGAEAAGPGRPVSGGSGRGGSVSPMPHAGLGVGADGAPPRSPPAGGKSGVLARIEEDDDACDAAPEDDDRAGGGGGGGGGDKWDKGSDAGDSSADGSQAASGITSMTDATGGGGGGYEMAVDARRGRLLRSLTRLLCGPLLMGPLEKLRLHSYALLAIMLLAHIGCYVAITKVIQREHRHIYVVNKQAIAMDRAQLLVVRVLIGTFCERANNTAKVSACTPPLSVHLANMVVSTLALEENHQGVYLGFSAGGVTRPEHDVYDVWTQPRWDYEVFMDTNPPQVATESGGVWHLGNRFIAAAREAVYWMPRLRDKFKHHRVYQFVVTNGLGALFEGYATSLDLLMDSAWKSLDDLRTVLIIMLLAEVLLVQVACIGYSWVLIARVEVARLLGVAAMLALPGPVLRQMAGREIKIMDDSDDDDDDEGSVNGQEREGAAGGAGGGDGRKDGREGDGGGGNARHSSSGVSDRSDGDGGGGRFAPGRGGASRSSPVSGSRKPSFAVPGGEEEGLGGAEGPVWRPRSKRSGSEGLLGGAGEGEGAGGEQPSQPLMLQAAGAGAEAEGGGGPNPGAPSRPGRPRRLSRVSLGLQLMNGKALIASRWRVSRFLLLLLLWFIALVVVYGVSVLQLSGMQGPLASLNMASHVIYRYTRVRAVGFSFLAQDDAAGRALWRDVLRTEVRLFASEYEALMYGGMATSQVNAVFHHAVPASTFASATFADEFFRTKRCFRFNQTLCAKPGSPYYEVTHNGLDTMVRRMVAEMELLVADEDADVAYNGTRWTFMYNVGTFDLYEGLQQAAQLFVDYSIERYNQVAQMHSILLAATILVFCAYVLLQLWPHLAKLRGDAARQSALLSHVPPEVDTLGHVRAVCKRAAQAAAKKTKQAAARGAVGANVLSV